MLIATVNAGSSSIKTALFNVQDAGGNPAPIFQASVSGIGERPVARFGEGQNHALPAGSGYDEAFAVLFERLGETCDGAAPDAVGHRIVHGGTQFAEPVRLDADTLAELRKLEPLAPRHQPYNIAGAEQAARHWPQALQIGCFDTAFHRSQPGLNQRYALPESFAEAGVLRYGFHGLSYESVLARGAGRLGPRTVIAHLGAGASLCAVRDGRSVATTMGFSTLDGLPMATRSGAIDPGVLLHLLRGGAIDVGGIEDLLYNRSGLLGLSGLTGDMRQLETSADPRAAQAIDYLVEHCLRAIAAMAAALRGIDSLVFTAGIGENSANLRARVVEGLGWLGFELDPGANTANGPRITTPKSRASAWVIPTGEEAIIASHAARLAGVTG